MVVKIIEGPKAILVDLFWQGSTCASALDLSSKEIQGRCHEGAGEDHEDERRPRQPLPGHLLHGKIETQVHWNIGKEEKEKERWEVFFGNKLEVKAEQSVDEHEDDEIVEPE